MKLDVFTDGGARGNPGPAAIGVVVYRRDDHSTPLKKVSRFIGASHTNNEAEYQAVIDALIALQEFSSEDVSFFLDSELVVKQLHGKYRIKQPHLKLLHDRIKALSMAIPVLQFSYVPREKNKVADALVNHALDTHI